MTTQATSASAPWRRARLARISAVQQMIGAPGLTLASPVIMPDALVPEGGDGVEELLADQRLDRRGVEGPPAAGAAVANSAPVATSDFPEPVGVERMTFAPETSSISASLWCAYGLRPRAATQPVNAS